MSGPVETPGRNNEVEPARQTSDPEAGGGDAELARHIRSRYGRSPGVIRTDVAMGLARRISRFTAGRLPLLAALQGRWSSAEAVFPRGDAGLVHVHRVVAASPLSSEGFEPQLPGEAPDRSESRAWIPSATGMPASQGPASLASSRGVLRLRPMNVDLHPVSLARDASGVVVKVGGLGSTILQRHLGQPLNRAVKGNARPMGFAARTGELAAIMQQPVDQASGTSEGTAESQSTSGEPRIVAGSRTTKGIAVSVSGREPGIAQRHLGEPGEGVIKLRPRRAEPLGAGESPLVIARSAAGPAAVASEDVSEARPANGEGGGVSPSRNSRGAMIDVDDLVTARAQRSPGDQAERAIQRRSGWARPVGVVGSPLVVARSAAGPAAAASEDVSEARPADREAGTLSRSSSARPAMAGAGDLATAIAQRHLGEQTEQAIRRRSGRARPVGVVGSPLVIARSAAGPAVSAGEDAAEHLGQHLSGGAEQVAYRQMELAKSVRSPSYPMTAAREDAGSKTPMSPTAPQTRLVGEAVGPVPPAGVSMQWSGSNVPLTGVARREAPLSIGASSGLRVLQRHQGEPGEGMTQILTGRPTLERDSAGVSLAQRRLLLARDAPEVLSVAGWPAMVQGDRDRVASETAVDNGPTIGRSAPGESTLAMLPLAASRVRASNVISRAGAPIAMGPAETSFARTASDGVETPDRAVHSGAGFRSSLPAMPLLRTAQRTPAEIGFGSASPVSDQLAISRMAAPGSAQPAGAQGTEAGSQQPLGELAPVKAAMPKLEGPELERVANEVYAIIERRLIVERESLGL
jgi:hypothetical protein